MTVAKVIGLFIAHQCKMEFIIVPYSVLHLLSDLVWEKYLQLRSYSYDVEWFKNFFIKVLDIVVVVFSFFPDGEERPFRSELSIFKSVPPLWCLATNRNGNRVGWEFFDVGKVGCI